MSDTRTRLTFFVCQTDAAGALTRVRLHPKSCGSGSATLNTVQAITNSSGTFMEYLCIPPLRQSSINAKKKFNIIIQQMIFLVMYE